MRGLSRLMDIIDSALLGIAAIGLVAIMGLGVAEIVARGAFNAPIRGQIDMVVSIMPLVAVAALSLILREDSHIRMALLLDQMPDTLRHWTEAAGMILGGFICGALALGAWEFGVRALRYNDSTPDLRLPTWPIKFAVAFCLALFALRCLVYAAGHVRAALGHDTPAEMLPHPQAHPGTERLENE